MYALDILIPTARFVFAIEGDRVDVLSEHRSPEAFVGYQRLKAERELVAMTTFPNTILLRGPVTALVDPGMPLQNGPQVQALRQRGRTVPDIDFIALTHAHFDHAGACWDIDRPVYVHRAEKSDPAWSAVAGILAAREVRWLDGDEGTLPGGIGWVRAAGHTEGSVCYLAETEEGPVALVGDTIGPLRGSFDEMRPPEDCASAPGLLAAWTTIRGLNARTIVPGHLPPFAPD